jgi:hypothetical protein
MAVPVSSAVFDLFLSHSKRDLPTVQVLLSRLKALGYSVWFDEEQIRAGDDWEAQISTGIRRSGAILYVASINSYLSDNCRHELITARDLNRRIIPLLLDREPFPDFLAWLGRYDHLRAAANGDHLVDLKRDFPPGALLKEQEVRGPSARHDELWTELPWLVDRAQPKERVEAAVLHEFRLLQQRPESLPAGGPMVIILHGADEEEPIEFQKLLIRRHLPEATERDRLVGTRGRTRFRKLEVVPVKPWSPDDIARSRDFGAALPNRLAKAVDVSGGLDAVKRRLDSSPACHLFTFHYLSTGNGWEMQRFLRTFVDFWAAPDWQLRSDTRCLVLLSVTHLPRKNQSRAVQRLADYGKKRLPAGRFLLLDALSSVRPQDVMEWLDLPAVDEALKFQRQRPDTSGALRSIFGNKGKLPMRQIVPALRKLLFS